MAPRRIGIVGGSGYIGHFVGKRLSRIFTVSAVDARPPPGKPDNIEYIHCDVTRQDDVEKSLNNVDLVIHTAIVQIPSINTDKRLGYRVNVVGTQNVCKVVEHNRRIRGMILAGSWHTIGERELKGTIDETYGFRPDKVEDRARVYALSKVIQECIVRFYDEFSEKVFSVVRLGTVLGEGMPEKTAANLFIEKGLARQSMTPYRHSMYRPMLYVDLHDVSIAFENLAKRILDGKIKKGENSLAHVANLCYPRPVTILELAHVVQNSIARHSNRTILPKIEIVDTGEAFEKEDHKLRINVDTSRAVKLLGMRHLRSPQQSIDEIVKNRLHRRESEDS